MKTLTAMLAAVVITTSAFAKNDIIIKSETTQSNSIITSDLSYAGNVISYSGKRNRKIRRSIRLLLKNPFRIVSLNRCVRY